MAADIELQKIGLRIQDARLRKKMTQEELAEACSRSAIYISFIERGTKVPSLQTIISIANALETTCDNLLMDFIVDPDSKKNDEVISLLHGCSNEKKIILIRTLESLKSILTEHGI